MILIFGGAYQGKLDYAKEQFDIEEVCDCSDGAEPDLSADAIYGIEGFVMECARQNSRQSVSQSVRQNSQQSVSQSAGQKTDADHEYQEAKNWFMARRQQWQDKILIITDTSQGVVPIDKTVRDFREMNGRLMLYLAREADEVYRVFCGIGKRIK